MSTLPEPNPHPQANAQAIELVAAGLRVLTTRDQIAIPEDLIQERARNIVTGLLGDFDLVPRSPGLDALEDSLTALRETNAEFRRAARHVGELLSVTR